MKKFKDVFDIGIDGPAIHILNFTTIEYLGCLWNAIESLRKFIIGYIIKYRKYSKYMIPVLSKWVFINMTADLIEYEYIYIGDIHHIVECNIDNALKYDDLGLLEFLVKIRMSKYNWSPVWNNRFSNQVHYCQIPKPGFPGCYINLYNQWKLIRNIKNYKKKKWILERYGINVIEEGNNHNERIIGCNGLLYKMKLDRSNVVITHSKFKPNTVIVSSIEEARKVVNENKPGRVIVKKNAIKKDKIIWILKRNNFKVISYPDDKDIMSKRK